MAEERGSSLSGDRPRESLSIGSRGPEETRGAQDGRSAAGPLFRQHQRLSINHSRSASLCSLSRLLALNLSLTVYRNATVPQIRVCLCVYVAHSAITITFCGSLWSRWFTMLRFELAMILPLLTAHLTLITVITLIKFLSFGHCF